MVPTLRRTLGLCIVLLCIAGWAFAQQGSGIETGSIVLTKYETGQSVTATITLSNFFSGLEIGYNVQLRFPQGFVITDASFKCTATNNVNPELAVNTIVDDTSSQVVIRNTLSAGSIPEQSVTVFSCGPIRTPRYELVESERVVEVQTGPTIIYLISLPLNPIVASTLTSSQASIAPWQAGRGPTEYSVRVSSIANQLAASETLRFTVPTGWSLPTTQTVTCTIKTTIQAQEVDVPTTTTVNAETGLVRIQPTQAIPANQAFILTCENIILPQEPMNAVDVTLTSYSASPADRAMDQGLISFPQVHPAADSIGGTESFAWFDPDITGVPTTFRMYVNPIPRGVEHGGTLTIQFPNNRVTVLNTVSNDHCEVVQTSYTGQNHTIDVSTEFVDSRTFRIVVSEADGIRAYASRTYITCDGLMTTPRIQASGDFLSLSVDSDPVVTSGTSVVAPKSTYNQLAAGRTIVFAMQHTTTANAGGVFEALLQPLSNSWLSGDIIRVLLPKSSWPAQTTVNGCTVVADGVGAVVSSTSYDETFGFGSVEYTSIKVTLGSAISKSANQVKLTCYDVIGPSVLTPTFKEAPVVITDGADAIVESTLATLPYITGVSTTMGATEASLELTKQVPSSSNVYLNMVLQPFESPIDEDCRLEVTFPSHITITGNTKCNVIHDGSALVGSIAADPGTNKVVYTITEGSISNGELRTMISCGPLSLPRHSASESTLTLATFSSANQALDFNSDLPFPEIIPGPLGETTRTVSLSDPRAGADTSMIMTIQPLGTALHFGDILQIDLPVGWLSRNTTVCTARHGTTPLTIDFRVVEMGEYYPVEHVTASRTTLAPHRSSFYAEAERLAAQTSRTLWRRPRPTTHIPMTELLGHPLGGLRLHPGLKHPASSAPSADMVLSHGAASSSTLSPQDTVIIRDEYDPETGLMGSDVTSLTISLKITGMTSENVAVEAKSHKPLVITCTDMVNPGEPQPELDLTIQTGIASAEEPWVIQDVIDFTSTAKIQAVTKADDPDDAPYLSQDVLIGKSTVLNDAERIIFVTSYMDYLGAVADRSVVLWQGRAPDNQNIVVTVGIFPKSSVSLDTLNTQLNTQQPSIVMTLRALLRVQKVIVSIPAPQIYPGACMNGEQDLGETDVDCGGDKCGQCNPGMACILHADCTTYKCNVLKCYSTASAGFSAKPQVFMMTLTPLVIGLLLAIFRYHD